MLRASPRKAKARMPVNAGERTRSGDAALISVWRMPCAIEMKEMAFIRASTRISNRTGSDTAEKEEKKKKGMARITLKTATISEYSTACTVKSAFFSISVEQEESAAQARA